MKEMIAENRITVTKKLFLEGSGALRGKQTKKVLLIVLSILVVFSGVSTAWLVRQGGNPFYTIGELFFVGFLVLWMFVFIPRNKSASQFKIMARNTSDGTLSRNTRFYDSYLQAITETGKSITISYKDIASWQETKHLWVLISKNHQAVMLGKDGFTQGSMDIVKKAAGLN